MPRVDQGMARCWYCGAALEVKYAWVDPIAGYLKCPDCVANDIDTIAAAEHLRLERKVNAEEEFDRQMEGVHVEVARQVHYMTCANSNMCLGPEPSERRVAETIVLTVLNGVRAAYPEVC